MHSGNNTCSTTIAIARCWLLMLVTVAPPGVVSASLDRTPAVVPPHLPAVPATAPCACNNIPDAHARAACCGRQHNRCRLMPAANGTGFPLGLCVPRQPKPPPHLFFEPCNISDPRQQWDPSLFVLNRTAAPLRNQAHGQCVSTRDERRQPYNPATGPYNTATVLWAHAPVVVIEAAECGQDGTTFTYDAARQTIAVAEFGPSTPFGRGPGGCLDLVSLNYSVSASTDM
eukprot:COSAG02_NODE_534_length_20663_cov_20.040945_4_plen_229_part_00